MEKRSYVVEIRFTKTELDALTKQARKMGLLCSPFIRCILSGAEVKGLPPAGLPLLIQEVRHAGRGIDRLLEQADTFGTLDGAQLCRVLEENRVVEKRIADICGTLLG